MDLIDYVLKTNEGQIGQIYCIGKNVCHNHINNERGLWKDKKYIDLFKNIVNN